MKKTPKMEAVPLVHARVFDAAVDRQTPLYIDDKGDRRKFWSHVGHVIDPKGRRKRAEARRAAQREAYAVAARVIAEEVRKKALEPPSLPSPPSREEPWVIG